MYVVTLINPHKSFKFFKCFRCLFVLPGNIAYFVIVVGGMIVIGKLFRQNRKTVERTTSRMEVKLNLIIFIHLFANMEPNSLQL